MSYGFSRDHSLDLLQTSNPLADTDTGVNPFSAIGRGIGAGISLAPQIAADIFEPASLDSDLDRAARSPMSMVLDPLRKSISDIAKGAAENAQVYRQNQMDAMAQSGEIANVAYGVSYGLSAFVGGGLNPASMGYGLGRARYQQEVAAGVDDATAQYIGAIEGTVGTIGAAVPFIGKNLVQRLGFGVAANVIPGMAQRGAEANVFGTKYADRAPEVFDPVAIAVDTVLGAGFGYLAGATPEKPKLITEDDINDALEQNANLRNADNSPGFPDDPESFGLHNNMISEITSAINEGRGADLRQILDANLKDSPEQIANLEQALADISDNSVAVDKPVFDRIGKDLTDTGIYTPEQSKYLARVASMSYSSLAKRMGRNVDDLYDEFPLKTMMEAAEALPMGKPVEVAPTVAKPIIQNRNRAQAASINQMTKIGANPNYQHVSISRKFGDGAPVIVGGQIPDGQLGKVAVATDAKDVRRTVRYAVVDADSVLASNNADGTVNAEYDTFESSPTQAKVVAGNGRVAGLQLAGRQGTAAEYRAELAADPDHGIDPAVIASMANPILVRVMDAKDITADIGDVSNTTGNLVLSAAERAQNDANRIDLDALGFKEDGQVNDSTVRQFVRMMPESEQGELIDIDGSPTSQAYDRINSAIFAKAYENNNLIRLYAQATEVDAKNVMNALSQAAPAMARLKDQGVYDIRATIAEAAEIAVNAARKGDRLDSTAKQGDLTIDRHVAAVVNMFGENVKSAKKIAEMLKNAADFAYAEATKPEVGLFGIEPKASKDDVIARIGEANEQRSVESVAEQGGREPDGNNAEGQAAEPTGQADVGTLEQGADLLETYTNEDIAQRTAKQRESDAARNAEEKAIYDKDMADAEVNDFVLSGSDAPADIAASRGQDSLFQSEVAQDLYVGHNLSEENVRQVLELGGLAAPSLGISRTTTGGFGGYGGITLIADKSILESKGARTFNADVYSPRQPRAVFKLNDNAFNKMIDSMADMPSELRRPDADEVARYGADAIARSDAARYEFLKDRGIAPKLKPLKVDAEIKQAAKLGIAQSYLLRDNEKFAGIAKKYYERSLKDIVERAPDLEGEMRKRYFKEDGTVKFEYVDQLARKTQNYMSQGGMDVGQLKVDMGRKMNSKSVSDAFSEYARNKASEVVTSKQLEVSPRRTVPYELDAVVAMMTKEIRGGEGFNYGAGNIRAQFAAEIKSIKEVQARRDEITSAKDFESLKAESQQKLTDTLDELREFYKYDADSWGYISDATGAIAEGSRKWGTAFRITAKSEKIIRDYVSYVKNLPTEYFETKMQRAMDLSEFKVAVVPKGTDKAVIAALEAKGLKIRKYDDKNESGRIDAIAKSKDLLFQSESGNARGSYSPEQVRITLTKTADPSTFIHELGHHLFEMLGKLAESPDAPKQIIDDFNTLTKRGGMTPEQWRKSTIDERRAAHEAVAEDFEAYLMTGEAPSVELKNAFSLIKDWMLGVYKSMRGEVQPDVAKVFDRLLATDEQIAMRHTIVDYAAVARRTDTIAKASVDDLLDEAMEGVDLDGTVILDGKEVLVRDLIADDPSVEEEAGAIKKLLGCMLNVR